MTKNISCAGLADAGRPGLTGAALARHQNELAGHGSDDLRPQLRSAPLELLGSLDMAVYDPQRRAFRQLSLASGSTVIVNCISIPHGHITLAPTYFQQFDIELTK